jgi:hypothetical protein
MFGRKPSDAVKISYSSIVTNIGNSGTNGIEVFIQYKFPVTNNLFAGLFTSTSYMDAKYITGQVSTGIANKSIVGNKMEAVPEWISRNGLDILCQGFSCTILYSYTLSTFSDALNTVTPPANGAVGFTPAYSLWDFNASLRINPVLQCGQASIIFSTSNILQSDQHSIQVQVSQTRFNDCYHKKQGIILEDLHDENVFLDFKGNLLFVDPVIFWKRRICV